MVATAKISSRVPKDLIRNLKWRRRLVDAAKEKELRQELWNASSNEILFWINSFVWTYNPKEHAEHPVIPFICWPYQEDVLGKMCRAIGRHDLVIEKSRDMGASWLCLLVMMHRWLFRDNQSFLLVSRVEDLVDKRNEPDCLMWKCDFILEHLPAWMTPPYERSKLMLANCANGSSITGASTTRETSRGGRKTAILFDEFASVDDGFAMLSASRDATRCRFLNSTPKGTGNAFARTREKIRPEWRIRMHWTSHPLKSENAYFSQGGVAKLLHGGRLPERLILDGKIRSPWYDLQCERAVSDQEIAQELDIDYHKSGWQFFSDETLAKLMANVRSPLCQGDLFYDLQSRNPEFQFADGGPLKLWTNVVANEAPAQGPQYIIGCDIAMSPGGRRSSRSAASVFNKQTGEKIAEMTTDGLDAGKFAEYVVALCRWFWDAYLIWESNGAGRMFAKVVVDLGYRKFYRRRNETRMVKKKSDEPGWYTTAVTKKILLGDYARALRTGAFINPSAEAIKECREYVHHTTGDIVHSHAATSYDPTQRGDNHGDIVIADALAWRGSQEISKPQSRPPVSKLTELSFAGRQEILRQKAVGNSIMDNFVCSW